MKFLNIVAKWPGSTHAAFIWDNCALNRQLQIENVYGRLLGDSAYPLRPWLMTPIPNAQNDGEQRYNRHLRTCRQVIEEPVECGK